MVLQAQAQARPKTRSRAAVHDPLSRYDLVGDEIAQRRETGHDVSAIASRYAEVDPEDTQALEGLYSEASALRQRPDWPYVEPSDLPGILAALPLDVERTTETAEPGSGPGAAYEADWL